MDILEACRMCVSLGCLGKGESSMRVLDISEVSIVVVVSYNILEIFSRDLTVTLKLLQVSHSLCV